MEKKARILPDFLLTLSIVFLLSLGILIIYSSDPKMALQQGLFALVGFGLYWLLSYIEVGYYQSYIKYLYIGILILLVVVFILGIETRGSVRWVQFAGLRFQPSEFAKPILILFLAHFWTSHNPSWRNIGLSLLWLMPIAGLIFKQPDLGTALTILMIWLAALVGANISFLKMGVMAFLSVVIMPIIWLFLRDYQKNRIVSFLSPERDPLGTGYNVIQSVIAVGSGQLFGRGLGRGTQSRLQFLPEFRTDFVFSSIAEELGFIGSLIVLSLYGLLLGRILKVLSMCANKFSSVIIFGILGMLFFQIVVNIGMNIGIMPVTGITLPLLSYGGSSIISILICLGFIASIIRFNIKGSGRNFG